MHSLKTAVDKRQYMQHGKLGESEGVIGNTNQFTEAPIRGFAAEAMEERSSRGLQRIFVLSSYFKYRIDIEVRVVLLHGRRVQEDT